MERSYWYKLGGSDVKGSTKVDLKNLKDSILLEGNYKIELQSKRANPGIDIKIELRSPFVDKVYETITKDVFKIKKLYPPFNPKSAEIPGGPTIVPKEKKSKEEPKEEIKEERKEEENDQKEIIVNENDYNKVKPQKNSLRIRANIVKVSNNEEHEESVSSEYDILQKISKYEEFKYKELVNENIESKDKEITKNNYKINKEKKEEKIITDKKKEKDENNQQENFEENNKQISPPPEVHSPEENGEKSEIIEDIVPAPEDSLDPQNLDKDQGEEHEQENIENYIGKVNKEELEYSPYQKENKEESIKLEEEEHPSIQHLEEENELQENEEHHDKIESMDINEENNEMEKQEENIEDKKNYIYIENQTAENEVKPALESYEIEENIQEQNEKVNQVENEQHKENEKEMVEEEEDEENIEKQLEEYCEEQNKKMEQKIKVYNILENKNINTQETNDSDSLVVFLSSSVKFSKNKIQNYDDEDDNSNEDNIDNDEMGPKNSIRNVS
jgi:hypothetical protein